jgi:hypothetical protein
MMERDAVTSKIFKYNSNSLKFHRNYFITVTMEKFNSQALSQLYVCACGYRQMVDR